MSLGKKEMRNCWGMFSLLVKTAQMFPGMAVPFYILPAIYEWSRSSPTSAKFGVLTIFYFSRSDRYIVVSHCGFHPWWLMNVKNYFFSVNSSLVKWLFVSFTNFKIGVFVFYCWYLRVILYTDNVFVWCWVFGIYWDFPYDLKHYKIF